MAPKAAQQAAQKKAAKQKKLLIVLAVPAIAAGVYAYSTFSSLGSQPAAAPSTPAAQTTPASAIPSATSGTSTTPVTPGISPQPVGSLHSFVVLGRKDPFNDAGPKASAGAGNPNPGKGGGSSPKPPAAPLTGAVISFNGHKLALALGNVFGHAPGLSGVALFRLVKVTPKSALIAVVGTQQQFTLHVREPLMLEQAGGWRYTLILEPLGSAAPLTTVTTGG
jgi:hypothetical protein